MHCLALRPGSRRLLAFVLLLMGVFLTRAGGSEAAAVPRPEQLTNLFQLRYQAEQEYSVAYPFRIVAEVMAVDGARGVLALRDDSGAEFVRVAFTNEAVTPGAVVCLEGWGCAVKRDGFGLALVPALVVDNDGVHPMVVETGRASLRAGMHPIRLRWFNQHGESALTAEYEGPGIARQPIPESALSRARIDSAAGRTNFLKGLDYRCYEGNWTVLPDFESLRPVKTGISSRFDPRAGTRSQGVGLEFSGFIEIPRDGVYLFHVGSDDGSRLFIGNAVLNLTVLSEASARVAESNAPLHRGERSHRAWVTFEGAVVASGLWSVGGEFWMRIEGDEIRVEVFDAVKPPPEFPLRGRVRVSGMYEDVITEEGFRVPGRLLVLNWDAVQPVEPARAGRPAGGDVAPGLSAKTGLSVTNETPVLSTAAEVKALSPELAQQRIPVSIRGVVTASTAKHSGAVIQDSTRGVFVDLGMVPGWEPVRRGELCQVDGVTGPGFFAPVVVAHRVTRLGPGELPKPVRASWVQLMNGSLDTEYAEIEGLVTDIRDRQFVLLTQGGKVTIELKDFLADALPGYKGAVIRIRGCWFANFNMITRKFEAGTVVVSGAMIDILERAPRDPYDAPRRSIGELLFYDSKAAPFRRLRVTGQVIHGRSGEYFLTDGTNGIHVIARDADGFEVGDVVDAVGFLELGGHAAVLKEAVMLKTGRAGLPLPVRLPPDQLLQARYAGTLVRTDAILMNYWRDGWDHVMELQSGFLAFRARINNRGEGIAVPPFGSRLEVTGVYSAQGAEGAGGSVSGFELLLSSPDGIRVLTTPPWWTLQRVLVLSGVLAVLLLGVLIWNKQLQRKVQKRGRQLEVEIRNRQRAETDHAAEAERSRIARDLHDELGTGLTEVSLLSSASLGGFRDGEKNRERFQAIAEKARNLVSSLDVIVWAVDPKHNSLQSLADYLESYTKELLSASGIACRCSIPIDCGAVALSGTARHSLLLAIKESLNNVIRHASATEVELQMSQSGEHLEIIISDNGCGFDWNDIQRGNGLTNLHERLHGLGGTCTIEPQPGRGTRIRFVVPFSGHPEHTAGAREPSEIR